MNKNTYKHSENLFFTKAIMASQDEEVIQDENPQIVDLDKLKITCKVEFNISQIISEINCSKWKNLNSLINGLIYLDCEIFGGAARDIVYRNYWTIKYYEYLKIQFPQNFYDLVNSTTMYDNPSIHPESYKGRTLLPNDLDIFINDENKFKTVLEYLNRKYNIYYHKKPDDDDDIDNSNCPYFIETNPKLKNILKYYCISIEAFNIPIEARRIIECLRMIIPNDIYQKLFESCKIKLDFIVLTDGWQKKVTSDIQYEYHLQPPFNTPDFRCNQISLVKISDITKYESRKYEIKTNWDFISQNDHDFSSSAALVSCLSIKMEKLQRDMDNLKIITDDIIEQRAIPVFPRTIIPHHRILKMELKGYNVDLSSIIPFIYNDPLTDQDKCVICFNELIGQKHILKPSCSECKKSLFHAECWAKLIMAQNIDGPRYKCPTCRTETNICGKINHSNTICQIANMLCALDFYRENDYYKFKKLISRNKFGQYPDYSDDTYIYKSFTCQSCMYFLEE